MSSIHSKNTKSSTLILKLIPNCKLLALLAISFIVSACGGGGGSSSDGGAAQLTLTADPTTISIGQTTSISWQALNSVSCRALEGWTSSTALSGNVSVGPLANTATYTMECLGKEGGPITESVSINVETQQTNPTTPATPGGPITPATPGGPTTPATPGGPTTPATPDPTTPAAPEPTAPPPTLGSAELTWDAPTTSEDGSVLTDLAGYTIYFGTNQNNLNQIIDINNAGVTTFVVNNLPAATYYFSISAKDTSNNESLRSNITSRVIQ